VILPSGFTITSVLRSGLPQTNTSMYRRGRSGIVVWCGGLLLGRQVGIGVRTAARDRRQHGGSCRDGTHFGESDF